MEQDSKAVLINCPSTGKPVKTGMFMNRQLFRKDGKQKIQAARAGIAESLGFSDLKVEDKLAPCQARSLNLHMQST